MKQKIILLLITLLVVFTLTEITFTILVDEDLDGNLSLNYVHLKPYKLPVLETEKKINELLQHKIADSLLQQYDDKIFKRQYFNVRLIPDTVLGWSPNPFFKSNDELYIYNKDGIRCGDLLKDYSRKRKLRIAIFGDSYLHGDEVKYENTIGYYLQSKLLNLGTDVEVMNFAVSGYGMDQAMLRWEQVKDKFQPDIVILGVQFENAKRHINLLRPFYYFITEIPYSKPRYILEGDKLQLLNNPINDINKTVDIIKYFKYWEFLNFEGFYNDSNYNSSFSFNSKIISFISSATSQIVSEIDYFTPQSESYKLTHKIIENFRASVIKEDKIFIPVHIPVKNDFDYLTKTFLDLAYDKRFIYDELFDSLKQNIQFVEPFAQLDKWNSEQGHDALFVKRHYSAYANKIVANSILQFLQSEYPIQVNNSIRKN